MEDRLLRGFEEERRRRKAEKGEEGEKTEKRESRTERKDSCEVYLRELNCGETRLMSQLAKL